MTLRTVVRLTPSVEDNALSDGNGSPSPELRDQFDRVVEGALEYCVGLHPGMDSVGFFVHKKRFDHRGRQWSFMEKKRFEQYPFVKRDHQGRN